jgi:zinc finger FYVE domain-containing protein 26
LCDLLCFHLDLACFVSSVNSGHSWNLRNSLLFSQKEQDADINNAEIQDPFVENLILERLAVQTPMKVSFSFIFYCHDLISQTYMCCTCDMAGD